jgi:hypothetical protein
VHTKSRSYRVCYSDRINFILQRSRVHLDRFSTFNTFDRDCDLLQLRILFFVIIFNFGLTGLHYLQVDISLHVLDELFHHLWQKWPEVLFQAGGQHRDSVLDGGQLRVRVLHRRQRLDKSRGDLERILPTQLGLVFN